MLSTYGLLGLPSEVTGTLFVVALIASLAGFISGVDLGVIRIPALPPHLKGVLRFVGLPALIVVVGLFVPLWQSPPSVSISVYSDASQLGSFAPTSLHYGVTKESRGLRIEPSLGYEQLFLGGGPIEGISFSWAPFDWSFPKLDLKIVNNTTRTLLFDRVVLKVGSSAADQSALIVVEADTGHSNALHFRLLNEGWGKASNLTISYRLTPVLDQIPPPDFSEPYPYSFVAGDLSDSLNVPVEAAFRADGVNVEAVTKNADPFGELTPKLVAALGPFKKGAALLSGELQFDSVDVGGKSAHRIVKFHTFVWALNQFLAGAPRPPSYEYSIKVQTEGVNYQVETAISQEIKTGDTDRFLVSVAADRSSVHRFVLQLNATDGTMWQSPPIEMRVFVPRSGASFAQRTGR